MATINLHGARSDLSNLKIEVRRLASCCTVDLKVGDDTVALFLDLEHADAAKVMVDLINDNIDRLLAEKVPV